MLGTIVNTVCIIVGSVAGSLMKKGIKPKYQKALFNALGLVTLALGFNTFCQNITGSQYPVLFIVSMAVGTFVGNAIDIDGRFASLVSRFSKQEGNNLTKGLSTACLLFCIGTFAIVGPMLSALYGDNTFLYTNSTLDLITSAVLAGMYGIGIIFAAVVLFLWQGFFYVLALFAGSVMPEAIIKEIVIVGGLLLVASGFSLLEIKDCKALNMLPALLIPPLFFLLLSFF